MSFLQGMSGDFLRRLAGGNMNPAQQDDDAYTGRVVRGAPPEMFQQSATDALRRNDPNQYQNHVMPGVGGTNPFGGLGGSLLGSVAGSLLGNMLGGRLGGGMAGTVGSLAGSLLGSQAGAQIGSGGLEQLTRTLGLSTNDPQQMSDHDVARVASYAQQNNPEALAATAAQFRDQPEVVRSVLGDTAYAQTASGLASSALNGQMPGHSLGDDDNITWLEPTRSA